MDTTKCAWLFVSEEPYASVDSWTHTAALIHAACRRAVATQTRLIVCLPDAQAETMFAPLVRLYQGDYGLNACVVVVTEPDIVPLQRRVDVMRSVTNNCVYQDTVRLETAQHTFFE